MECRYNVYVPGTTNREARSIATEVATERDLEEPDSVVVYNTRVLGVMADQWDVNPGHIAKVYYE